MSEIFHPSNIKNITMDRKKFHKILFLMNALENGWTIKQQEDVYIFTKKHENKREIFMEDYINKFIEENFTVEKI